MQRHIVIIEWIAMLIVGLSCVDGGFADTPTYVRNGSFETLNRTSPKLPREWDAWNSESAKGDIQVITEGSKQGRRALQMTYSQSWRADQWIRVVQRFKGLQPDVPYTLSAYVKQVTGESSHRGLVIYLGNRWKEYALLTDAWENNWKKVTIHFVPAAADFDASGDLLCVIQLDVPGVYCIDDLQIQPYSPVEYVSLKTSGQRNILVVNKETQTQTKHSSIPKGVQAYSLQPDNEHRSSEAIRNAQDVSAVYALAYSDKGLHLYVDVTDDVVYTGKDYLSLTPVKSEGMYNCDSIQVSFDQGLDRTPTWDDNDQEVGFTMDVHQKAGETWSWTMSREPSKEECEFTVSRTPKGYFVDALFTWNYLDKIDRTGKRAFGFNIIVNDNDGQGRKGWLYLSRGIGDAKHTQDAAVAVLNDSQPNVIGLFKDAYVDTVSTDLLLYSLDRLNGQTFDLVMIDGNAPAKSLLFSPVQLACPPASVGLLPLSLDISAATSDKIIVQAKMDGKVFKEFSLRKIGIKESIKAIEQDIATLIKTAEELQNRKLPVGYLCSKLAVLSSQTLFAKDNLKDYESNRSQYYLRKALRRVSEMQELLAITKREAKAIEQGNIMDRFRTYRYVHSPVEIKDGYPQANAVDDFGQVTQRPVVFNGYCTGIDWNIDFLPVEGKAQFVKEDDQVVEVTGQVAKIVDKPSLANTSMSFFENLKLLKTMGGNAMFEICKPTWSCHIYNLEYSPNFAQSEGLYSLAKGMKGPFYYNSFKERFSDLCTTGSTDDYIVTLNLWAIYMLPWVYDKYPEIRIPPSCGGGSFGWYQFQYNSPNAKTILAFMVRNLVREFRDDPNGRVVHSIDIANEVAFDDTVYNSPFQQSEFLKHLKTKYHQEIANFNQRWKTSYKTFEEILPGSAVELTPDKRAVWWEWHVYAQETCSDWHRWLAGVVRETWPEVAVYAKPIASGFARSNGCNVDFERFAEWSDLNACDTYSNYNEGDYKCTWLDAAMNYDLLASLKRTAIINAENHIIRDAEGRDIPYEYVYTTLFQQYMHGLSLSSTWSWMEQPETGGYDHVKGLFAERPMCIAGLNQATMDANRLIHEIQAFFNAKPKVAILYSPTAMIKDIQGVPPERRYDSSAIEVYKQLSFMGYKIGFVSEKQIAEGKFGDIEVILVPSAAHVLPDTARGLQKYSSQGRSVVTIGKCLAKDPYDNPLKVIVPTVAIHPAVKSKGFPPALKNALETKLGKRPIEVTVNDGIPDGIEWKIIRHGEGYLLNLVNYNKEPRKIELINNTGVDVKFRDLITFEHVESNFTLEPLRPMLIQAGKDNS